MARVRNGAVDWMPRYCCPAVISHATNVVEHPELVAERLVRLAHLVGSERVIASTDCGFAQGPFGGRYIPRSCGRSCVRSAMVPLSQAGCWGRRRREMSHALRGGGSRRNTKSANHICRPGEAERACTRSYPTYAAVSAALAQALAAFAELRRLLAAPPVA